MLFFFTPGISRDNGYLFHYQQNKTALLKLGHVNGVKSQVDRQYRTSIKKDNHINFEIFFFLTIERKFKLKAS